MKKYFFSLFVFFICTSTSYAQNESNYAAPAGGTPTCNCTAPSSSTCTADCLFSSCCICGNPNTQTGACGCYWGGATCRNEYNTTSLTMDSFDFGVINPNSKIMFSFEKFNLLFNYFESKGINPILLQNTFLTFRSNYVLTGKKILVDNSELTQLLSEYAKLINKLNASQKEGLNNFINSLK